VIEMAYDGVDWAGKERRMVRMNSNTKAAAVVVALIEHNRLSPHFDVQSALKDYSEFFEGLVYKGFEEKK